MTSEKRYWFDTALQLPRDQIREIREADGQITDAYFFKYESAGPIKIPLRTEIFDLGEIRNKDLGLIIEIVNYKNMMKPSVQGVLRDLAQITQLLTYQKLDPANIGNLQEKIVKTYHDIWRIHGFSFR
ncbi:MAG: hypothetical protein H6500_01240 [Candidatus Woesearchaeota archaeon]|nr:hypothetical protein [Nanoarchaeota archaeon]USN44456.1 MAG: hypothetical protein H6500_01240 [Candidatus Woesearchaeota archaeon]